MVQAVAQSTMRYEAQPSRDTPDTWVVGAVDHANEGVMYVALFSGQNAEERAHEYAEWKNAGKGWMPRTEPLRR